MATEWLGKQRSSGGQSQESMSERASALGVSADRISLCKAKRQSRTPSASVERGQCILTLLRRPYLRDREAVLSSSVHTELGHGL